MGTVLVLVEFRKAEINNVDFVFVVIVASNQKVVWFYVSMNYFLLVNSLNADNHLHADQQRCFQVELAAALLKEVFKRKAKLLHDHHIMGLSLVGFIVTHVVELRNSRFVSELVDQLALPEEHGVVLALLCLFDFSSVDFASSLAFDSVNIAESAVAELLDDLVFALDDFVVRFVHVE